MDLLVFDRARYEQLYNCSMYSVDDVPLKDRTHAQIGLSFLLLFVIFEVSNTMCSQKIPEPLGALYTLSLRH